MGHGVVRDVDELIVFGLLVFVDNADDEDCQNRGSGSKRRHQQAIQTIQLRSELVDRFPKIGATGFEIRIDYKHCSDDDRDDGQNVQRPPADE